MNILSVIGRWLPVRDGSVIMSRSSYAGQIPRHLCLGIARPSPVVVPSIWRPEGRDPYQATDEALSYTDDYGAWFNKGGIGGTIQNPCCG